MEWCGTDACWEALNVLEQQRPLQALSAELDFRRFSLASMSGVEKDLVPKVGRFMPPGRTTVKGLSRASKPHSELKLLCAETGGWAEGAASSKEVAQPASAKVLLGSPETRAFEPPCSAPLTSQDTWEFENP